MSGSYYSQRLLERMQRPKFYRDEANNKAYHHFHCFIPTDTGRTEDEYRVDIFYRREADQKLELYFQSNMTPLEQALLDAALELYLVQKNHSLPSTRELDYFLRDKNDSPCTDSAINFKAPIEAIELLDWHISSLDLPKSYSGENHAPFLKLPLEEQLHWSEKAIERFLLESSFHRRDVELIAIDGKNIVINIKNEQVTKNILEKLSQFLVDFFKEKKLKLIVD